jgi:hemerythrin-like metal-binding protein
MAAFKWTAEHSVHLPEVDAEHRSLFLLAASLRSLIAKGAPIPAVEEKLQALLSEAEDHFTHEERMMRRARYTLLAWHKSQHDALRKRAKACVRCICAGELEAGKEFLDFLARWLPDHMAVADNMMGAAIRNYQRSPAA